MLPQNSECGESTMWDIGVFARSIRDESSWGEVHMSRGRQRIYALIIFHAIAQWN